MCALLCSMDSLVHSKNYYIDGFKLTMSGYREFFSDSRPLTFSQIQICSFVS